ncbi:signal peptidase I [Brevundimonas sp. SORGH_AS_0993]|uniref:signal peptidase I n=1 Tax=Brevundimonas sp. SORGH_AS_0993 TaxID=3041794 RepID=UPI0027871D52|nr:signal peptidase I [Brevundimonas sp. SORGH_AS_0993]MDQ1153741.1 signal peptidase I [Brevundimonas sp. SORGH_AS_0993]
MTQAPAQAPARPQVQSSTRPSLWRDIVENAVTLAVALIVAVLLRIVLVQPFTIPSSSMEPGLITGDYIVVSQFAYGWSPASLPLNTRMSKRRLFGHGPARGDVVVFRRPHDPAQVWIKRVIGLPGDTVQVRRGVVYVNGQPILHTPLRLTHDKDAPQRPVLETRETLADGPAYLTYDGGEGLPGDDTPVYRVPQGQYFMMGDNRDNSLDSRWPADLGVGFLPAGNIIGRAEWILLSWNPGASLFKPWTWLDLRPDRFLVRIR